MQEGGRSSAARLRMRVGVCKGGGERARESSRETLNHNFYIHIDKHFYIYIYKFRKNISIYMYELTRDIKSQFLYIYRLKFSYIYI